MDKFTITTERQIEPLNIPQHWDEINISPITKYASNDKVFEERVKGMDLGGFDIVKEVKEHPEHLFVKVFAIKKDEVNDNGDYFSEKELKKAAKTFIGVPVFVNHQNDDIEKARGKVRTKNADFLMFRLLEAIIDNYFEVIARFKKFFLYL